MHKNKHKDLFMQTFVRYASLFKYILTAHNVPREIYIIYTINKIK